MICRIRISWMLVLLLAAIALPAAHAEKYYVLTAHLAGQQVIVSSVKMENVPVAVPEGDGNYLIEVASLQHEVLYSGRYELGSTPAPSYIPHDIEGNYLTVKKSTGEVLQRVSVALFSSVCGDRLCQSSETAESCTIDCATESVTVQQPPTQEQPESTREENPKPAQVETPASTPVQKKPVIKKPAKKSMGALIIWASLFGVLITSGGFWFMLKKAKEQRLGQIRQYLQKYAYYPQEQVKRALLMRGIKEEDIQEALRQN